MFEDAPEIDPRLPETWQWVVNGSDERISAIRLFELNRSECAAALESDDCRIQMARCREKKGMSEPAITIGVTCFREGDWLRECWESVLAQTDDRWAAVLVMDGGADEHTREIFEQIVHPRLVKYAMPQNMGPYPTRNKAFELTRTPYHFYLDGDDRLPPDAVAWVLETWDRHPEAGFVYGDYERFGAARSLCSYPRSYTIDAVTTGYGLPGPCAYKVDLWARLGGYSDELARGNGDYDLQIGAVEAGVYGQHCGHVFYHQRSGHTDRVSSSYLLTYYRTHEIMVRRHPLLFRQRRRRWSFLAYGYRRSALAHWNAGNRIQAAWLAARAIGYGNWRDIKLWRILLRGFSPRLVISPIARVRSVGSVIRRFCRAASGS